MVIALRAMFGQDEANHGTTRYCVGPNGLVIVPREAAAPLLDRGGFARAALAPATRRSLMPATAAVSLELVALRHASARGCSFGGKPYCADDSGVICVPPEAAAELADHGFVPVVATPVTMIAISTKIPSEDC